METNEIEIQYHSGTFSKYLDEEKKKEKTRLYI